jgi:hypothetical protein
LDGVLSAPPAVLADAREAADAEAWWFEMGWWQGYDKCQHHIAAANKSLFVLLEHLE